MPHIFRDTGRFNNTFSADNDREPCPDNLNDDNFQEIFDFYYPKLFRFFANQGISSTEDIRDLIQNTFFDVYSKRGQFKDSNKLSAWIFAIGRNNMIDWFRKKRRKPPETNLDEDSDGTEKIQNPESGSDLLETTISKEFYEIVLKSIEKLPKRMAECILMRAEDYSYHDIAMVFRISQETVKSQLYQGRKRLREMLQDLFDEFDF